MTDTLIISTYQKVFVWTPDETRIISTDGPPFFGLTWDYWQRLYVGARCMGRSGEDALLVFDKNFEFKEKHWLSGISQSHQMIYWNGGIYITDTAHCRICRWDTVSHEIETVHCPREKNPTKQCHLNSLWWDGDLFYVGDLFGKVNIFTRDWRSVESLNFDFQLHNIYVEDGKLIVCASDEQGVYLYDLATDEGKHIDVQQHIGVMQDKGDFWQAYTRGIARSKDYFYIGCAAVKTQTQERQEGPSAIAVFDNDWQFVQRITLPDTGGFQDVRVLGDDRAHNGIVWK